MKLIQIGVGSAGLKTLERLRGLKRARLVAGVAPEGDPEQEFARVSNVKVYPALSEALREVSADAVVVCTPLSRRSKDALQAIEAGLAVMTEVPWALDLRAGRTLVAAAKQAGKPIMAAHRLRFARPEHALHRWIKRGWIGEVIYAEWTHRQPFPAEGQPASAEYVQLFHAGGEDFDAILSVIGIKPVSVISSSAAVPWKPDLHGAVTQSFIEDETGIRVQYFGSLTSGTEERSIRVEGRKGVLWTDRRRLWWRKRGWPRFLPLPMSRVPAGDRDAGDREGAWSLFETFREALSHQSRAEAVAADHLRTQAVLNAAIESDRLRRSVRLDVTRRGSETAGAAADKIQGVSA